MACGGHRLHGRRRCLGIHRDRFVVIRNPAEGAQPTAPEIRSSLRAAIGGMLICSSRARVRERAVPWLHRLSARRRGRTNVRSGCWRSRGVAVRAFAAAAPLGHRSGRFRLVTASAIPVGDRRIRRTGAAERDSRGTTSWRLVSYQPGATGSCRSMACVSASLFQYDGERAPTAPAAARVRANFARRCVCRWRSATARVGDVEQGLNVPAWPEHRSRRRDGSHQGRSSRWLVVRATCRDARACARVTRTSAMPSRARPSGERPDRRSGRTRDRADRCGRRTLLGTLEAGATPRGTG